MEAPGNGFLPKWNTGPDKTDGYFMLKKLLMLICTDYIRFFYSERKDVRLRMGFERSK